jgi:MOSC domain-containing protein YiiM
MMMQIQAISISETKGVRKNNVESAALRPDHGIVSDAHAGPWHRQVSLLARESIDKMVKQGLMVRPGDFAENITTEGIDLTALLVGEHLRLGSDVIVEVTQIGKECHDRCAIYYEAGDCVMPREGIFVKVLSGGTINTGDPIARINQNGINED